MAHAPMALLAIIDNLGTPELLALLLVALVVIGPDRLPEAARSVGRGIAKLRHQLAEMKDEFGTVADDPTLSSLRELGEFAARPRHKLEQFVREAERDLRAEREQALRKVEEEAARVEGSEPAADAHPFTDPNTSSAPEDDGPASRPPEEDATE